MAVVVVTHAKPLAFSTAADRRKRLLSLLPLTMSQDTNRLAEGLCAVYVRRRKKENEEIEETD